MSRDSSILSGELGLIGLFDLGQLLMLNRATGTLNVTRDGARGQLIFLTGQLINAIDDTRKQGIEAAYRIFTWKNGLYEFRSDPPQGPPTIEESTEGIMLEAARRMDEAGEAAGEGAGAGLETKKLVERQGAFDALRDEFHRVAREAESDASPAPAWSDPWLALLQMPDDRMLVRPNSPPRLKVRGVWHPSGDRDAPLDAETYEDLKTRLLAGSAIEDLSSSTWQRFVRHRGRTFAITLVRGRRECLWIAPTVASAIAGERVRGPFEVLDQLFSQPGALLLAAAPTLDSAHVLVRAIVVHLTETRGATVVVVSDDTLLAPAESTGVVLPAATSEAEAVIRAARPTAIAVDAMCALDGAILAAIATTPFVIGAVVAAQAEAAVPRWLTRFPASESARAASLLDSASVAVVLVDSVTQDGALNFAVHRMTRTPGSSPALRDPFAPVEFKR